ncbi:MAG TPA: C-terminal helicase domain-containing protein, partial [Planctomycetota bacterium]|nr:C-terminal helicase domain-containing protein [Planctomycetota bacterium]
VEARIRQSGIQTAWLDGSTRDRGAAITRFQEDLECKVFLISLKAGGTGLNLVAADYVFLLDPWWNPAAEDQAADRAHRIGQTKQVFVYRLVTAGTVEERVLSLQADKRAVASRFLESEASGTDLKPEDLRFLLAPDNTF